MEMRKDDYQTFVMRYSDHCFAAVSAICLD
jgi:hypothetical protein